MIFLTVAKELCDKKCDHIGGTFNQIPSTDEIMPDLNHSGIYNAQNSQKTLCLRIYIILNLVVRECQITDKVYKERENANIDLKKKNCQANCWKQVFEFHK